MDIALQAEVVAGWIEVFFLNWCSLKLVQKNGLEGLDVQCMKRQNVQNLNEQNSVAVCLSLNLFQQISIEGPFSN